MPKTPENSLPSSQLSKRDFLKYSAVAIGELFLGPTIRRVAQLFPALEAKTPSVVHQSPINLNLISPDISLKCWVPKIGVDGEGQLARLRWPAGKIPDFAGSLERDGYERYTFGPSAPTSTTLQTRSLPVAAMIATSWGYQVVTFAQTQQWERVDYVPFIAGKTRTDPPVLSLFTDTIMSNQIGTTQPVIIELQNDQLMDGSLTLTRSAVLDDEAKVGTESSLSYLERKEVRNAHLTYLLMTSMLMDARNRVTPGKVNVNSFRYPDNLPPISVRTGAIAYSNGAFEFMDKKGAQFEAGVDLDIQAIIPMFRSGKVYPIWQVELVSPSRLSPTLQHRTVFMDPSDVIPITAGTLRGQSLRGYATVAALAAGALVAKKVILPRLSNPAE